MNTITAKKRDFTVKAKQLRRAGIVPGNLLGGSLKEPVAIQLDMAEASSLVRKKREGSKLTLEVEGKKYSVQLKEKKINTLNGEVQHLEFQALAEGQKVNSLIHILLENADKVTDSLEKMTMEIPYASLPEDMIDTITIDVDGMEVGTIVTVGDIPELKKEEIELQIGEDEIVFRLSDRKHAPAVEEEPAEEQE